MLQENPYLSPHLKYLSLLDSQSVEQLIYKVLDLDQEEQQLLNKLRKQQGQKICGQQLFPNIYYIRCHDCGISQDHLFCQPCFDETLHKNHYLQLLRYEQVQGFCDCGDPNLIKEQGFCKSHSKQTIQTKLNSQEIQLLGKLKILLEISCYNAIRLLEQSAKLPIIKADKEVIQASQYLTQCNSFKQTANKAYEKMNAIIIYLTGSHPQLSELVCQVFTSCTPMGLQQIQQFSHSHDKIFDVGKNLENNLTQICQCSVWKNLLRYLIFLNIQFQQRIDIEIYLPHLLIDDYTEVITNTFVEMIPFQLQAFKKVKFHYKVIDKDFNLYFPLNYQEGLNNYLQSQEVKEQICSAKQNKEIQLTSYILGLCYQLKKSIIQQFQYHKESIEYVGWFMQQGVLTSNRFLKILHHLRVNLFRKLDKPQIMYCLDEFYLNNPRDSYVYRTIINLLPFKPYLKHSDIDLKCEEKDIQKLILNQCQIIRQFDQSFRNIILNCENKVQKMYITKILLQGLIQRMIQTHPKNKTNQFKLEKWKFVFALYVPADHIVIILLSFYLQLNQVKTGKDFIQILISDLQISREQLEAIIKTLVQRAIQNIVLLNDTKYLIYYCRKKSMYLANNNTSDISQESLDRSLLQLYFFLYGEQAIVIACSYLEVINKFFNTSFQRDKFLHNILGGDFDMYQTCSHYFKDELPQDFKAAQRKVIRSLFYAQNYLSYDQILESLNEMGNNQLNMVNQKQLLDILELEPCSGLLKLKKQYQPPLFEPLFFKNQAIPNQIQEKFNENNDQEVEIFGNSIEFDFSCNDENYTTLSSVRKHIIEQLIMGQNQMVSIIILSLRNYSEDKMKTNIIKKNKYLIYIFIMASKYLILPEQNKLVLQKLFNIIELFCCENDVVDIMKRKIIGNQQIVEVKQTRNNNEKLLQIKQKFQQKQLLFENNQGQFDGIIQNKYDPNLTCNLCCLQMEQNQIIYQIALLQQNNNIIHSDQPQDRQYLSYLDNLSHSKSEIMLSGCTHIFHKKCTEELKVIEICDESFYQCVICYSLGNIIFPASNFDSKSLLQDIQFFNVMSKTDMLEYYYKTYKVNSDLDIKSINAEIVLQIYLHLIRQIIENPNFYDSYENLLKFQQFTKLMKEVMDEQINNQYQKIINNYPQSVTFQVLQQIIRNNFNLETQVFSEAMLKIIVDFGLLDQCNQDISIKLFNYQTEIQQFQKSKSTRIEQYRNIRDLQKRLIEKCIKCQNFTQYICMGCNQKICNSIKVIHDYKSSCCYLHSLKCHNGNVNILDAQTGLGYVSHQSEIISYKKSLFKNNFGQKFEDDFHNSIKYIADRIAFEEFYQIKLKQAIHIQQRIKMEKYIFI
ncbi:E3 ubiquitin-protein ligase ubr3 [Paramecium bursaria]